MRQATVIVTGIVAASALAFGGYWLGHARGGHGVSPPGSTEGNDTPRADDGKENTARTIDHLERRLAALEVEQALAKAAAPPAAASQTAQSRAPEPERFDPAKEEERRLERAAAIEAAVRTEARDSNWASPTESQLQTAVGNAVAAGAKFSVKTLRCLTTICDMVLAAPSAEDLGHITEQLASQITGMSSLDLSPPAVGADGRATVTCRLFRQGYPRPDEGLM